MANRAEEIELNRGRSRKNLVGGTEGSNPASSSGESIANLFEPARIRHFGRDDGQLGQGRLHVEPGLEGQKRDDGHHGPGKSGQYPKIGTSPWRNPFNQAGLVIAASPTMRCYTMQ